MGSARAVLPLLLTALLTASPDGRRAEADRLYDAVELDAAAAAYTELVATSPDDPELRIRLAECLIETDRFAEAIEHAERAVELTGGGATALAALGLALHRKGDFDGAADCFHRATAADAECGRCWWGLARVEAVRGDYEAAGEHFQRAAALEPDNPIFLRHLAPFVTDRGKSKELYARYLELPRREEMSVWENTRSQLALLEYAGDRRLKEVELPDQGAEVPITERGGMSYLTIDIGSRKNRRYLLDTGASGFTISTGTMKRLGLEPIDAFTITGIGGEGKSAATMVLVDEVRVGEAVVRNVPAVVRDGSPLVDGVLGPTLFGGVSVTLDHENGRLRIGAAAEPDPEPVPQEEKKGKKKRAARPTVEIPFLSINATPFIPIEVNGLVMNAMVDTGASQASLSEYSATQVPDLQLMAPELAPPAYRETHGVTGRQDVRVVRKAGLTYAGRTLKMVSHLPDAERVLVSQNLTPLSHAFGTEVWAILGNPQLDDFNLTIDWRRQVIRMTRFR